MSSYRGNNYTPVWKKPSNNNNNNHNNNNNINNNNNQNKSQNGKDRASSSNNNRFASRSPSYNSNSSNNSDSSQSASRIPNTGYQYRRTPSILKKYANFNPPKYADVSKTSKCEPQNSQTTTKCLGIPKSRVTSCSPPSANQKQPTIRLSPTKGREKYTEIVTRVTRATSPTPARNFSHLPRKADDDVLISDAPRRRNVQTIDRSTQTDVCDQSASRMVVLSTKFSTNSGSTNSRPISPRIPVYNYPKATLEPPWRASPEPSLLGPPQKDELLPSCYSPQQERLLRTPSPLANLNNSITNLTLEQADNSSDTENESSYEEDYPMRLEKDPYPLAAPSNGAVKPPIYPLSPKSRIPFVDNRPVNVRSSSSDELPEVPTIVEPNIPFAYQNNQPSSSEEPEHHTHPKYYPIRKMDSGELPWWQNSTSDHSSDHQAAPTPNGYVIRKMDSTDIPWWTKDSPSETNNRPSSVSDCNKSESEGQTWCVDSKDDGSSKSQGYIIRKMDSTETPWWNKDSSSEVNNRTSSASDYNKSEPEGQTWCVNAKDSDHSSRNQGYVIRKMDSAETPWWNKDSPTEMNNRTSSVSDYNRSEPEGQTWCVDAKDSDHSSRNQGYVIRKMDSPETPWWNKDSPTEANNRTSSVSDHNKSEPKAQTWCVNAKDASSPKNQNYVIPKMDSFDTPWWCKSNDSHSSSKGEESRICVQVTTPLSATPLSACKIRKMDSNEVLWSGANSEESHSFELLDHSTSSGYKLRKFDSGERDWWAEDERSKTDTPDWCRSDSRDGDSEYVENYTSSRGYRITRIEPTECENSIASPNLCEEYRVKKIDSGEEAWWFESKERESKSEDSSRCNEVEQIQDAAQSEGSYQRIRYVNELENLLLYIGKHTNIDELLGTEVPPPAAPTTPNTSSDDEIGLDCEKIAACQVKIHDGSAYTSTIRRRNPQFQLDDAALQLYKDGDYSSYLDLDSSISEQQEEFEGFQPNRKDSIVVRTQLSVRVHSIIEKLMKSEGRELRRALFSLKQIFQEDKDLVHEFVQNDGLDCLIKVGSDVDQNYQNYILRALGQVMLYVDGMNGVMEHNPTIQWLYSLVSSKFRLVVKTVLKLLLVFVEYVESNCLLLIKAIHTLNTSQGLLPWSNLMRLLHEYDATDTELLIYAMTLINKTLNGIPDQDTYYDQVDLLEEQDIESVIRKYMSKPGTDLDLLRQFQIYEAVLQHEDGEEKGTPLKQLDEAIRKTLRNRKSLTNGAVSSDERRKSRRHSTGTTALSHAVSLTLAKHYSETSSAEDYRIKQTKDGAGVTPGLRKRRERDARQRSLLREQYQNNMRNLLDTSSSEDGMKNGAVNGCPLPPQIYVNSTANKLECAEDLSLSSSTPPPPPPPPPATAHNNARTYCNGDVSPTLKREATVKDITQKLASLQTPADETAAAKPQNLGRVEEMKGIISKAMEGLAKSQSRCDMIRSPTSETPPSQIAGRAAAVAAAAVVEVKKSETDLHWEELLATSRRALQLCDLDFCDLHSDDEHSVLAPTMSMNGIPPPPPPCGPCGAPPPVPNVPKAVSNKGKKTVKLFWKEVREDPIVMTKLKSKQLIWDEMYPVIIDTQRLEHLFESRAKDLITKKQHELNKNKEIIVLDPKRSNAINIGMTKLPPPRSIKTAILKMDSTVINREGIEKLLTMLPSEEERSKIQEAQVANPELPLGSAEHFLLTLASISELTARLKLWAFKLNYENIEKEIADPLMDLKQGMEVLRTNKTFRAILSTLLSIGIFLNGLEVKGFQIEYLAKVPEVKDTVHKHSLLHHLCHIVMEKFPDSTDLYSEIGAITRASRVDFDDLGHSIVRVEQECKASFDHLKAIAKHDGNTATKLKLSDFLVDCAERIIALGKIHRRILNRFYAFCLWLGIPLHRVQATKPNELCKVISEFALEYRTTRERVLQQLEKKASHRERNKTRGKMITEVGKFRSKEDRQDAELRQLLKKEQNPQNESINNNFQGTLPWRRLRKDSSKSMIERNITNGHLVDADDELLETLVKTATKTPAARNGNRERKRTRHTDRKSLRRTLKNGLTDEERNHLSAFIKSY